MAYKSLIDYYGGGMVKPSDGYQLGGLVAKSGRQRGYTREFKNLKDLAEQSAKRKEKVGGNWLRKLAVGTVGTLLGGPMGGGAALAADQYAREKKFKKTDFSGGKYAQDVREKLGKREKAFKEKGLARVGIAGVEGYLGGKSGGAFGKPASFLKGLPTDISMIKGAMAAKDGATFLEAAKGVGWDIPSMFGGKDSIAGSLLPSIEPKATNAPSLYEQSDAALASAESGAMQAAGMTGTPAQDFSYENIPSQYKLSESEWAVPPTGAEGMFAEEQAARIAGRQEPELPLAQPETPVIDMGVEEPEMLADYDEFSPEPYGPSFGEELLSGQYSYPSYGSQVQQTPEWAGGFKGGGLVDYMMPQGYQGGGQVGYGTATDPEQALRQMGMDDVADDPALEEHLDDLPQFTMGYKQQLGDVTAGARTGLLNIGKEGRLTGARTGFAGGGGWMNPEARQEVQRQFGSQKRGIVESHQADLLSAIADIEQKIGGDFTFGGSDSNTPLTGEALAVHEAGLGGGVHTPEGIPEGWPSRQAFDNWTQAGANPDNATMYGWQAP